MSENSDLDSLIKQATESFNNRLDLQNALIRMNNVRAIHKEKYDAYTDIVWCSECESRYPCRTLRILDGNLG